MPLCADHSSILNIVHRQVCVSQFEAFSVQNGTKLFSLTGCYCVSNNSSYDRLDHVTVVKNSSEVWLCVGDLDYTAYTTY